MKNILELLTESRDLLQHTRCVDDDAFKCPACSLESRIDDALRQEAVRAVLRNDLELVLKLNLVLKKIRK